MSNWEELEKKYGGGQQATAPQKDDPWAALEQKYTAPPDVPTAAPQKPAAIKDLPQRQGDNFGAELGGFIKDIPRQLGRTARAGLQGVGGIADFVSSPIRGALNLLPGVDIQPGSGQLIANSLGLPKPRPGAEAIADSAAEMVAGGVLPIAGGAALAKNTTGVTQSVGNFLAAQPARQLASAGAAGGAGAYVRETGGEAPAQFAASLAAGLATPFAMNKVQQVAGAARSMARSPIDPQTLEFQIDTALRPSGMTMADLPFSMQQGIRQDVAKAYDLTGNLSTDAIRRLADYRLVGANPTAAGLTLDPAIVTQQKNLAKLGINSKDASAQQLGRTANENNAKLIENINNLGAGRAGTPIEGGRRVMDALEGRNASAKAIIDSRYEAARQTNGRSAALDPYDFTQKANNLLDDALLGGKLPSDVRNLLNKAASGAMPLTVDVAEQFKTRIGELQRATVDMAERKALGMVRQALDDTPLLPGQQMGQQSIDAFNKARAINRSWMGIVDKTPALQAVRDGIEPDKFVQQFITGGGGKANVADVKALHGSVKGNPDAMQAVKEQITGHLKAKALNGAADEVGNLSQSAYNKALREIGDEKLGFFFTKPEIDQMKAIGRVASYEQFQPVGSAINNSNTAGTLVANLLDRFAGSSVMSKIPFGNSLQQPVQNIVVGMKSRNSLNVPRALAAPKVGASQRNGLLASPALLMGTDDED